MTYVAEQAAPTASFLDPERLLAHGPYSFTRAIERLLLCLGFEDIRNIDAKGDEGGDILAAKGRERWVFQCKWSSRATIDGEAVKQVDAAKAFYGADRAVVATNARPGRRAIAGQRELRSVGVRIDFWDRSALARFTEIIPRFPPSHLDEGKLHEYQKRAVRKLSEALGTSSRALMIMATGLGKTVVAGEIVRAETERKPIDSVLLVAHTRELVAQLERAIWRHLPKETPTQILDGEQKPPSLKGVTCATVASALTAVQGENPWAPQLVVVDEAHHVAEEGTYATLLDKLGNARQLGVTATPWRGDRYDISAHFGDSVFRMGIADGMAAGFLTQVDYRLLLDANIEWDSIADASETGLNVKDLNRRLFLPQRDDAIIDELQKVWQNTPDPRAIVFCRTINHAEEFAQLLRSSGWRRASALSTRDSKRDRNILMSEFRDGRVPVITAVDVLNEGVDVPDVNILCFLRVTHSRRIFVQQLGRGLRVRPGKDRVTVLDFVSDIRRVAATENLRRSLERLREEEIERLELPDSTFEFSEPRIGTLLQEWIEDAASLEDAEEETRLQFPGAFKID
jgi:superfamily II DNA or RNA helicase